MPVNFLALREFRDLADLNAQAKAWVMQEAGVRPGGHPKCPTYGHPKCSTPAAVI